MGVGGPRPPDAEPGQEAGHSRHRTPSPVGCTDDTDGSQERFSALGWARWTANAVWLELPLTAIDLLAWTRTLVLDGELADAEPKKLRYRLLHAAARITRSMSSLTCCDSLCGSPRQG